MTNTMPELRKAIRFGLIAGVVSLCVSAIGMTELFGQRELISGILTLGQVIIFLPTIIFAFTQMRNSTEKSNARSVLEGVVLGAASA